VVRTRCTTVGPWTRSRTSRIAYERYAAYRQYAHLHAIPEGRINHLTVECRPVSKLAGTSQHSHNGHRAHRDSFSQDDEFVTWNGFGHFNVEPATSRRPDSR
jgi:hypothetical protein